MSYLSDLRDAIVKLEMTTDSTDFVSTLAGSIYRPSTYVYICGNGGSAAIANHFAADVCKVMGLRSVTSLCDSTSMITAVSNDVSYSDVFVEQLKMAPQLDALICVSSSGNSPNVVNAARYALGKGAKVFTLSGFYGTNMLNTLPNNSSRSLHVESHTYGIVEDVHMAVLHAVIEKIKRLKELP